MKAHPKRPTRPPAPPAPPPMDKHADLIIGELAVALLKMDAANKSLRAMVDELKEVFELKELLDAFEIEKGPESSEE